MTAFAAEPEKRPLFFQGTSRCAPGSARVAEGNRARRTVALAIVESIMNIMGILKEGTGTADGANSTCEASATISNMRK
jgi:hypothetical protein